MRLEEIARTSGDVAATSSRRAKIQRLASCLAALRPDEVPVAVAYLSGALPHDSIGVGWATLQDLPSPARPPAILELLEVDAVLRRIGALAGAGSSTARRDALHGLFVRATEAEQRFLRGLLTGEIRQGALEGVMVEAVAQAAGVPAPDVRRAAMLAGDLGAVGAAAIAGGRGALRGFRLTPLTPIQPMLAKSAEDISSALDRIYPAAVEWKLDGARYPVASAGRRGARLHEEPRRRDRAGARDRGGCAERPGRVRGPRRGGDRAAEPTDDLIPSGSR